MCSFHWWPVVHWILKNDPPLVSNPLVRAYLTIETHIEAQNLNTNGQLEACVYQKYLNPL